MPEPSASIRRELEAVLQADTSRVGAVYRLDLEGLNADEIAKKLGVRTSGFVSNNRSVAKAFLEGVLPRGKDVAKTISGKIRQAEKIKNMSPEARQHLSQLLEESDAIAGARFRRDANLGKQPTTRFRSPKPTTAPANAGCQSLRNQTDQKIRERVLEMIERIRQDLNLDADDYWRMQSSDSPVDALAQFVLANQPSPTFTALRTRGRLDLCLEDAIVRWARDLPIRSDVIEAAKARLDYWEFYGDRDDS